MDDRNGKRITRQQLEAALGSTIEFVTGSHLRGVTIHEALASGAKVVQVDRKGTIILLGYSR